MDRYHSTTFLRFGLARGDQFVPLFLCFQVLQAQLFFQFSGQFNKDFLYAVSLFGRALHIYQIFEFAKGSDLLLGNLPLVVEVGLVADEEEDGVLFGVGLDLVHPKFADVFEAEGVGEIEDEEDSLASAVVGAGDGAKAFLACRVPDLELDIFVIDLDGLEAEVHADGGQVVLGELVLDEAHEDSRLTHPRVADDDCLVQMVELLYHTFRINKCIGS